ncbi:hypothetical protein Fot_22068 [Forsythia ovata]|uniref:Uncharacterized protein n=1 Tax=Forsythia ovata TaxID=205694 RepID=A0ABD1UWP1_9LAMI
MVNCSSFISLVTKVTSGVPFILFPTGHVSSTENFRRFGKRKVATDSNKETSMPGKGMEDARDSRRTGRGRENPSSEVEDRVPQDRRARGVGEDVDVLCLENNDLREQLAFYEYARARAIYDITKAKTIQKACVQAQKKAESHLRSCQNMIHAKDKELTEVSTELFKALRSVG